MMNIFNRIIMSIMMICIIVFCVVAIVNTFANLFEWSDITDRIINSAHNLNRYALGAILFLIFAVALLILVFEFYRKRSRTASISADSSGSTMVTVKTSEEQIKESLNEISDVVNPQVKIISKQGGIIINIFSKLVSGVNVAEKTKEIREKAVESASKNLSLKVVQTNYTATGFVPRKIDKDTSKNEVIKEAAKENNVPDERQTQNIEQDKPFEELEEIFEEKKSDDIDKT